MTAFDPESRRLAHQAIDLLFDHLNAVDRRPVVDFRSPAELEERARLTGDGNFLADIETLLHDSIQLHHRSYMGHQVCPPLPVAIVAEMVISALNQSTAVWEMSPLATMIEREVVRWLADQVPYPEGSLGTAVSGGTAANLTALLAARARLQHEAVGEGESPVILCAENAHYSITRAAMVMGMKPSDVISIGLDEKQRMDVDELAGALEGLAESGRRVMAIVATAGSTSAGAFDDLPAVSDLRDRYRTWLHVDAAHGASVLLSRKLRHLAGGLERADSLSWDPHKMMWMPLSLGIVLVRDGRWLRSAFEVAAPYLFHKDSATPNLGELTLQCSRRADAVKLWLALRFYGVGKFEEALDSVAATTRHLFEIVKGSDDFEALHEPAFNIFCFRYRAARGENLDDLNATIRRRLNESGRAWITTTVVSGKRALRVTIINPRTSEADVEKMLADCREIAREIEKGKG